MDNNLLNINQYSQNNIDFQSMSEDEYNELNIQFFNAVVANNIEMIKSLANLGANLSSQHQFRVLNKEYNFYQDLSLNAVSLCIINENIELIKLFSELGYDLCFNNSNYLFFSCGYGNKEITKFLIKEGCHEYLTDERFLLLAIENHSSDILNLLLQNGGDIYFNVPQSLSPSKFLDRAILWNKLDFIKLLVEYGALIKVEHFNQVHYQSNQDNNIDILEYLFEQNIPNCSYKDLRPSFFMPNVISYFDAKELSQQLEVTLPKDVKKQNKIKV